MSHHLDSELSRADNRLDLTDQFVFRGEAGTVFVMDVNSSAAGPTRRKVSTPRRATSSRSTPTARHSNSSPTG
jgi:hypothetical protein